MMKKTVGFFLALTFLLSLSVTSFAASNAVGIESLPQVRFFDQAGNGAFVLKSFEPVTRMSDAELDHMKEEFRLMAEGDTSKIRLMLFEPQNWIFYFYVLDAASLTVSPVVSGEGGYQYVRVNSNQVEYYYFNLGGPLRQDPFTYRSISYNSPALYASNFPDGFIFSNDTYFYNVPDQISQAVSFEYTEITDNLLFFCEPLQEYTLTIQYLFEDGSQAAPAFTQSCPAGAVYSVDSPFISDCLADLLTVSGVMPAEDVSVTVTYAKQFYVLTIHYKYDNGLKAAGDVVRLFTAGAEYAVASPYVYGYAADQPTVSGVMPAGGYEVTVVYSRASSGGSGSSGGSWLDNPFQVNPSGREVSNPFQVNPSGRGVSNPFQVNPSGREVSNPFQLNPPSNRR